MTKTLVIVPCGQGKVWDDAPDRGPVAVRDAYTGAPFKVNRQYAERFGDRWVILSAKYGFIAPDFLIPGPYNVTFKRKQTSPVGYQALIQQVREQGLDGFETVIGLGGKEYRAAVEAAFRGAEVKLVFPFAGLPLGKGMRAIKAAVAAVEAFPEAG